MTISEKELEDFIFYAPQDDLENRGLFLPKYKKKQVRIGNYGVADIVGFDRARIFTDSNGNAYQQDATMFVVELKKDEINVSTFLQAIRYAKGIKRYFEHKKYRWFNLTIILVGSSINLNDFVYINDVVSSDNFNIELHTYSLKYDGIHFKEHSGYCLTNEGFTNNNKDIDFEDI